MAPAVIDVLGDDLLREILLRLTSPEALVRAALALRSFLRAARDAAFLRRFRARHPSEPRLLLGFLFVLPDGSPPVYLSAASASSELHPMADFSLSYLPGREWDLLDCRDGLLLLRNHATMELAVVDPSRRAYCPVKFPTAAAADLPVAYGLAAGKGNSSSAFRVVCIARDSSSSSSTLRALVFSSEEFYWEDSGDAVACATSVWPMMKPMKANGSLFWRLDDGKRMAEFDATPGRKTMSLSILDLPPIPAELAFGFIDTDDGDGLRLLTMREFRLETWKFAGGDGMTSSSWTLEDTSVRLYRALEEMLGERKLSCRRDEFEIVGVVDGIVFFLQSGILLSIDLNTMKLHMLSEQDCSPARIFAITRAWPPPFLRPSED
uniref:F-box protein AT5G49610-like beta-propeller domain-containing protein n=1 Tax=Leersia perrieri TaxID=77586 RepID=A0A0D9WCS3_9ORYZ